MADEAAEVETEVEPNPLTGEVDSGEDTVELLGQDGAEDDAQAPTEEDQPLPAKAEGHRSAELQKLIDGKYGGSEEALAKAIFEQQNSSAQLFKELKSLREEFAASKTKPEEETKAEDDPDVSSLNDQRALVVEELEALKANHDEMVSTFNKLSEELIEVKTLARVADDYDKPKHEARKGEIERFLADLKRQYAALPRESKRLTVQLSLIDKQIKTAQGAVQTRSQAKQKEAEQEKQWQAEFSGLIDQYIDSMAKEKGIVEGSKRHTALRNYVRSGIHRHLASLDPNGQGIDPVKAVQHFSNEYLDSLSEGAQVSFKTASATKQAAATPPSRPSLPGARAVKAKDLTKEQIEAHKAAVLG